MYEIPTFEIYLDVLFLLNFFMDYFIFWMVSKITYQKVTRKRLVAGALIAAVLYCLVVISPFLRTMNIIIYLIFLPLIPIHIIFKPKKLKQWLQIYIIANITALVIGGMSYGIFYWVQEQGIVMNVLEKTQKHFSLGLLFFSSLASYIIIQSYGYYKQKRNTELEKRYAIAIVYKDEMVEMEALLDTGNKVYDPISKHPVIIAEYKKIKALLPPSVREVYTKTEDITCVVEAAGLSDFKTRIRLIPYHSLGNPNGILLGFKADYVCIEGDLPVEDVIIGIYKHNLSRENNYHALLHGDLVTY